MGEVGLVRTRVIRVFATSTTLLSRLEPKTLKIWTEQRATDLFGGIGTVRIERVSEVGVFSSDLFQCQIPYYLRYALTVYVIWNAVFPPFISPLPYQH